MVERGDVVHGPCDTASQRADLRRIREHHSSLIACVTNLGVVVLGCSHDVALQVAAKPLHNYTYALGLVTGVLCIPVYGTICLLRFRSNAIPRYQVTFLCSRVGAHVRPIWFVIGAAGSMGALQVLQNIGAPYVSGPILQVIRNSVPIFAAIVLGVWFLGRRYSLLQCLAAIGALLAAIIGVLPSFEKPGATNPFFAGVECISACFSPASWLFKESLFKRYRVWCAEHGYLEIGLDVTLVAAFVSVAQLACIILLMPLNRVFGQTHHQDMLEYFKALFTCVFGGRSDSCGIDENTGMNRPGAEWALYLVLLYSITDISWYLVKTASVKYSSTMSLFIVAKIITPVDFLLFALVKWPLLGRTTVEPLTWVSLLLLLPAIAVFFYASARQDERASSQPSRATCCYPLLQTHDAVVEDVLEENVSLAGHVVGQNRT